MIVTVASAPRARRREALDREPEPCQFELDFADLAILGVPNGINPLLNQAAD
jgi:hypothetical protein